MLEKLRQRRAAFDIVHFHTDYVHFPLSRECDLPHISTLHGRLDLPDLELLYRQFDDVPVVSISKSQRKPLRQANWVGNVYHGMPKDLLKFQEKPGKYLAFIGRISPEKRPDRAIEIATMTGMHLKIAAKVDRADTSYFQTRVKPMLSRPNVEFIGEIGDDEKGDFLGNALACLAPIDWPEPFGLNMIEAMACGTPTIAFEHGSVPEIIEEGVSGFIVNSVKEAAEAVGRIGEISRAGCRKAFERRFTDRRMTEDYLRIYRRVAEQQAPVPLLRPTARKSDSEELLAEPAA